jgi:hypothetical protein
VMPPKVEKNSRHTTDEEISKHSAQSFPALCPLE